MFGDDKARNAPSVQSEAARCMTYATLPINKDRAVRASREGKRRPQPSSMAPDEIRVSSDVAWLTR